MRLLSNLENLDNIPDGNIRKLSNKVDKVSGKGLSTNDYTQEDKDKLAGIQVGAEVNVQSDWNQNDATADDFIKNKPTNSGTSINYENSGYHNCIYRGNDVTSYYNDGTLFTRISSGKFTDLYIGDYFKVTDPRDANKEIIWRICGFNTYYRFGSSPELKNNHVIIMPDDVLVNNKKMYTDTPSSNGYTTGYVGSNIYTVELPNLITNVINPIFIDSNNVNHVQTYSISLSTSCNATWYNREGTATGGANDSAWQNNRIAVELPSETQIFGTICWSSTADDDPSFCIQFPIFAYAPYHAIALNFTYTITNDTQIEPTKDYYELIGNDYVIVENPIISNITNYYEQIVTSTNYWLRNIANKNDFVIYGQQGSDKKQANSMNIGIRPYVIIG